MKSFWKNEDGYILILMLLFMPVFVGLSLLVIDVSRGNNAQSDLYAAADAMALAAARELDGGTDAIIKAKAAMLEVDNSVSLLAPAGADTFINLQYEDVAGNEYTVIFLREIPDNDDDPIDQAWVNNNATTVGSEAEYVLVEVRSRDLATVFFNPATLIRNNVPIGATAVATRFSAACNVTPIYICNPFENTAPGFDNQANLSDRFQNGALHGRIFKLQPGGQDTEGPGNFGFLQVESPNGNGQSPSANALNQIFAGGQNPTCYSNEAVDTAPGAMNSLGQGINVRFDIYDGQFGNDQATYPPSQNVRKGYVERAQGPGGPCNQELFEVPQDVNGNPIITPETPIPYLDNVTMVDPGASGGTQGASLGSGGWNFDIWWDNTYAGLPAQGVGELDPTQIKDLIATNPDYNSAYYWERVYDDQGNLISETAVLRNEANTTEPSRNDVFEFEKDYMATVRLAINGDPDEVSTADGLLDTYSATKRPLYEHVSGGGESGAPLCSYPNGGAPAPDETVENDRRVIFAAIIDCETNGTQGMTTDLPVNSFASVFMVNPLERNGNSPGNDISNDATLDVEIIGLSSAGGGGLIENFVRDEAVLVR